MLQLSSPPTNTQANATTFKSSNKYTSEYYNFQVLQQIHKRMLQLSSSRTNIQANAMNLQARDQIIQKKMLLIFKFSNKYTSECYQPSSPRSNTQANATNLQVRDQIHKRMLPTFKSAIKYTSECYEPSSPRSNNTTENASDLQVHDSRCTSSSPPPCCRSQ